MRVYTRNGEEAIISELQLNKREALGVYDTDKLAIKANTALLLTAISLAVIL